MNRANLLDLMEVKCAASSRRVGQTDAAEFGTKVLVVAADSSEWEGSADQDQWGTGRMDADERMGPEDLGL